MLDDEGRVAGLRLFDGDVYPASPYAARVELVTWRGRAVPLYTQEAAGFQLGPDFQGEIIATYAKNAKDDMSPEEKRMVASLTAALKAA